MVVTLMASLYPPPAPRVEGGDHYPRGIRVRALIRLLAVIVIAGVGTSAVVAGIFPRLREIATAHDSTSSLPELDPLAQRSVMYDRNGNVIAVFKAEENRKPVSIKDMSQDAIDSVLAVEDAGYYKHKGVNGSSLIRAVLTNISAGEVLQGGSTITQQVVKLALVGSKRDANRKIREAVSLRISSGPFPRSTSAARCSSSASGCSSGANSAPPICSSLRASHGSFTA